MPVREGSREVHGGTRTKAIKAETSIPLKMMISPLAGVNEN